MFNFSIFMQLKQNKFFFAFIAMIVQALVVISDRQGIMIPKVNGSVYYLI